jgi:hypothetical protein
VYQQIAQNVFFGLDGESLYISIGVVHQLHVEVGPNTPNHLSSKLEHRESGVLIRSIFQLMHVVPVFFLNHTLQFGDSFFDRGVPHKLFAT